MRDLHAIDDIGLPRLDWVAGAHTYGPMLRELIDHPWLAKYRGEVAAHVDRLEAALERARTIDVPQVVCHYDMQPHNVLVDDGGWLVAVVDWCWGELAPREQDLFVAFRGPDPVGLLRDYGAKGIDLTHLEYMLLERSIRYTTGRVEHEVEREFVDGHGFDWCRRIDSILDLARPSREMSTCRTLGILRHEQNGVGGGRAVTYLTSRLWPGTRPGWRYRPGRCRTGGRCRPASIPLPCLTVDDRQAYPDGVSGLA